MTLPTSHTWLVRVLDAYSHGTISWDLAYSATDHAARELASDDDRQAALDAWGLFMDAHTIRTRLGRGLGKERRLKRGRADCAIASIIDGHDPADVEASESYGTHATARLERTDR